MQKTKYVIGFLYNESFDKVLLIEKKRPEWQKGKLNGVGGHIKESEIPLEAMIREFREETGLIISNWDFLISTEGDDWIVYFFRACGDITKCESKDEIVMPINVSSVPEIINIIPDLKWLIPLSLDLSKNSVKITNII